MQWITDINDFEQQQRPEHPYFAAAYDFIESWLGGKKEFILNTSGSTGTPKPIAISRNQLTSSAAMTGNALALGSGTRALVCLNISYIAGLMMLVRGMELGWKLTVIEPASNPLLKLDHEKFDFTALVPLQLSGILENPETESQVYKLGKILLGGAPVGIALQRKILDLAVPVYQSYGMTETVSHVALRRLNGEKPELHYTFLPGIEFGLDERNCLYVSGAVTNGEKVQTNDLVEIHGNTFKWIGRADNIINSGGIKMVLDEVDARMAEVFYNLNIPNPFFAWFRPDEKLGQMLILIIEGTIAAITPEMLLAEIRKQNSAYETPKHVYFVDQFTRTATDKVDKRRTVQSLSESSHG
ncbi:AMP-binding protein [Dyadobacter flavalbus]|uniref:AMP-binding protein n=1 Tax=Dyadobacter flavalbus TaxID=2579942 RepID=A0A5M8QNM4_9BACT|nr:AMP-binding protein [Dyadobacter flavalbus]KAA6436868.1 AMP-binding protein [Dyadobacter flavalbus]